MGLVAAVIVAAGSGTRFGGPKQFELLRDLPLYRHSVNAFLASDRIDLIVVVTASEHIDRIKQELKEIDSKELHIISGGHTRQESSAKGLRALAERGDISHVLFHDAARPLVDQKTIGQVVEQTKAHGAAIAAVPVVDTLKRARIVGSIGQKVSATVSRQFLWRAQTPQGARLDTMLKAFQEAEAANFTGTDESELLERMGILPVIVESTELNFKITVGEDLDRARTLLPILGQ